MVMVEHNTSEAGGGDEPLGLDPFVMLAFVHESFDGLRAADLTMFDDDWLAHLVGACDSVAARRRPPGGPRSSRRVPQRRSRSGADAERPGRPPDPR